MQKFGIDILILFLHQRSLVFDQLSKTAEE